MINKNGQLFYKTLDSSLYWDDDSSKILSFFTDQALLPFQSSPMVFAPVGGPNIALLNHVITTEEQIETSPQCMIVCMMNKCQSFNFSSSKKVCMVNDKTKDDHPLDFTSKQAYRYYHPMNNPIVL